MKAACRVSAAISRFCAAPMFWAARWKHCWTEKRRPSGRKRGIQRNRDRQGRRKNRRKKAQRNHDRRSCAGHKNAEGHRRKVSPAASKFIIKKSKPKWFALFYLLFWEKLFFIFICFFSAGGAYFKVVYLDISAATAAGKTYGQ
jgi:hypothetical protein